MGSSRSPVGPNGEILLDYSVYDALRCGFGKVVFVIRSEILKEWPKVGAAGIPIMVEDATGLFHHKFAVIDGKLVITGSYNWSGSVDEQNFEKVVFIECADIAQVYTSEFSQLWEMLGGVSPSHPIGQDLFVELMNLTSPVKQGAEATVEVRSLPGAECTIRVRYKSGYSTATGLYAKTVDESGIVVWTWTVGTWTTPGTWPIYVTVEKDGETARL